MQFNDAYIHYIFKIIQIKNFIIFTNILKTTENIVKSSWLNINFSYEKLFKIISQYENYNF